MPGASASIPVSATGTDPAAWPARTALGPAILGVDPGLDATAASGNDPDTRVEDPMTDFERLSQQIAELQGSMLAMECFINSLAEALPADARPVVQAFYASETAAFRAALMNSTAPEATVNAFERDVQRATGLLGEPDLAPSAEG